jgi:matrix metalloproteinase-28 (epilysin)
MAPYYKRLGRDALLSWDDVLAVQNLYGEPLARGWCCPCPSGLQSLDFGSSNRMLSS